VPASAASATALPSRSRRARVAREGDGLAFAQQGEDALRRLALVVLVQRHDARADAQVRQERAGHARVLGRDHVARREGFAGAGREVAQVPDGRCHHI
jgi:hypothetical protein